MKLAIFTDTYLPQVNGVVRTTARITAYLREQNVPFLVFTPDCGATQPDSNVHTFPAFDLPFYPECKIALPSYSKIKNVLNGFKPDLLHVLTEFSMGLCGTKYASEHRLPVVASYTTNFPQYLSYYKIGFLESQAWSYLRWFHNQCDLNLCPTQETRSVLLKRSIRNTAIWGRGIDTDFFAPHKKNDFLKKFAPDKDFFFLYVGRLAPEKNLDVIFNAWEYVSKRLPEAALVITGDGPQAMELKQKKSAGVIFTGYLHGEELAATYASSDVFVFPSTTETFGNVVLEAMASGLPVVAAAAGGVKNLLQDGSNGIACRPRSSNDMILAMLKLAGNKELRNRMGSEARQFALKRSWAGILEGLLQYYREITELPAPCHKAPPVGA
ncbi:Glycosyltransferase involved in cell wall bisynthesis [Desulfotomaculum arcticum]|uniref:Glycosyltransferase involved in cell wall bisynthesis n=1 Tax=Desulfotruncus arcticus DSM 17038 TaxID=1121424 RepID=A0A1I2PBM6_9FIRM|nr:glycosyltransferase family 1 protein [Desulfotruncus arcticus]SFG11056.1 Glycosyltransferase involved in cell wall bisynthesis [Desulfotomaculum arcticum] [Desulfotruncus arcticus DSM 17038]